MVHISKSNLTQIRNDLTTLRWDTPDYGVKALLKSVLDRLPSVSEEATNV